MSREETYCVKKKFTKSINPIAKISKNGNKYVQSTCVICRNKKSSFIKDKQISSNGKSNGKSNEKENKQAYINDFFYKKKYSLIF